MPKKNIIIIGSGVAGLATALRLSHAGYQVRVFESNNHVGGKMSEIRHDGYRFDTGPSLFTMPQLIDELIAMGDDCSSSFFEYLKIDITCRYFFNDGVILNAYSDTDKFVQEVSLKTKTENWVIIKYLKYIEFVYKATSKIFIEKSLHKLSTYLSFTTFKSFLKIPFLSIFKTMDQTNRTRLGNDKLIKIFNRYATYNGSNPFVAPGILSVIAHLELNKGVFLPKKGMRSIVNCLYDICLKKGVEFNLNSQVDKISLNNNKVNGIYIKDIFFPADIVISNIDIHYVYTKLLDKPIYFTQKKNIERSTSAIIFYWGIKKRFNQLDLHNILFTKNYAKEFDEINNFHAIQNDPTIYINITSKHLPEDAPKNCENWFVMINVSHDKGQNWKLLVQKAREQIITKINHLLNTDIESFIDYENYMDPTQIESKTGAFQGALYGSSSNKRMSAFLRHPNFSNKIQNLYFCGGTVHPGGGIPLALNSAKIVANEIISNEK
ncbi:MAG: phytoene dehydrogenase [Flavobacteriales bacterium]|nr:phytoene dehydrogenase [Flavobacteriales bacterium]